MTKQKEITLDMSPFKSLLSLLRSILGHFPFRLTARRIKLQQKGGRRVRIFPRPEGGGRDGTTFSLALVMRGLTQRPL